MYVMLCMLDVGRNTYIVLGSFQAKVGKDVQRLFMRIIYNYRQPE